MKPEFDPASVRSQFPSLKKKVNDRTAIYLDGPGGTQVPEVVSKAISAYLMSSNANMGGAFTTSRATDEIVHGARQAMADFFHARRSEEIVFGQNMTSLTFAVSRAISRQWKAGDEIIVTRLDHDANISPWVMAAQEKSVTVRWWDLKTADCTLDIRRFAGLLNSKTRLVAVTHASNATGTIVDVAEVARLAHQTGALVYVDAVHYAPHSLIDVQAIDCDFLAASAYKFFGPHVGVFYGKYELLDEFVSYKVRPASNRPPGKWETGTQNFEGLAGVLAAVDYLASIGRQLDGGGETIPVGEGDRRQLIALAMSSIKEYEEGLSHYFLNKAASVPGLKVYGITDVERLDERVPTFAVSLEGFHARQVAEKLGEGGIFVWDGHYYAVAVMERLGLLESGGLVRIGLVHYNTRDEIDQTMRLLIRLAAN